MRFQTSRGFEAPGLSTDAVVLDPVGERLLLVQRAEDPFAGAWVLPGGFVEVGETTEAACVRELAEETGLEGRVVGLVGVYSDPDRDPRGHIVSVAYRVEADGTPEGGDDAGEARWWALDALPDLAFDHAQILQDALAGGASARDMLI